MPGAENEAIQIAAIKELLDRGFGRAIQPLAGDRDAPLIVDFRGADVTDNERVPEHEPISDAEAGVAGVLVTFSGETC